MTTLNNKSTNKKKRAHTTSTGKDRSLEPSKSRYRNEIGDVLSSNKNSSRSPSPIQKKDRLSSISIDRIIKENLKREILL